MALEFAQITKAGSSGNPIEINTPEGMAAAITESNIGKFYKYTGPSTAEYNTGDLYIVQDLDNPLVDECSGGSVSVNQTPTKLPISTGYISSIYVDTTKTTMEEVDSVLEKIPYTLIPLDDGSLFGTQEAYLILTSTATQTALYIVKMEKSTDNTKFGYIIMGSLAGTIVILYDSVGTFFTMNDPDGGWLDAAMSEMGGQVGEVLSIPIGINLDPTYTAYDGSIHAVGTSNDLLLDLLYMYNTPAHVYKLSGNYTGTTKVITTKDPIDLFEGVTSNEIPTKLYIDIKTNTQDITIEPKWYEEKYTCDYGYEALGTATVAGIEKRTLELQSIPLPNMYNPYQPSTITANDLKDVYHTIILHPYSFDYTLPSGVNLVSLMFQNVPIGTFKCNYIENAADTAVFVDCPIKKFISTSIVTLGHIFTGCHNLELLDLHKVENLASISKREYLGTPPLTIVIRNTSGVCNLTEGDVCDDFYNRGTLYVPDTLMSAYRSDTKWANAVSNPNTQIRPLGEYVE